MGRHIIVLLLNLLKRVKWLITNNSNYIHPSGMTWHHMALCCIVLYMDIYVSHNTGQVEALFSAFQLHERVRLRTRERERQRKRKRRNSGTKRRREAQCSNCRGGWGVEPPTSSCRPPYLWSKFDPGGSSFNPPT